MQVVVLLLLVLALALLVLGLISGSTPLVVASIAASLLAAYAITRHRRRRETAAARPAPVEAERRPATAEAKPPVVAAAPATTGGSVSAPAAVESASTGGTVTASAVRASQAETDSDAEFSYEDEPATALTEPPLETHSEEPVWVIDGRPRYHLASCIFIIGRRPEPVSLRQAVEDGFSPCAQCDPDTGLVAG